MKNKQKTVSKILTLITILCSCSYLSAQIPNSTIEKADSLFISRQYTQSLELYKEVLAEHKYSESMLLKMAFIQEGLGKLSESLYYLNLYYLSSDDELAQVKMNDLATKNHLQGYKPDQTRQFYILLRKNSETIIKVLVGTIALFFGLLVYQKKRQKSPMPVAITLLALMALLFLHVNFSKESNTGIVNNNSTYLMSGPSAGSSVINIIDAGHLLNILDKKDVWLHVKWMNEDAYLKEDQILMIQL